MFGTLAPVDFDQGTLEFIENPDPAAATSCKIQGKIRIACDFCRSRKARCSGGWETCERCKTNGLECIYSEDQGQSKRQENRQSRKAVTRRGTNLSISVLNVRNDLAVRARNGRVKESEETSLPVNLHLFDDSCIDKSLDSPSHRSTSVQHSRDSGLSGGTSPDPGIGLTPSTGSSTVIPSGQLSRPSMQDTSSASMLIQLGDMEAWKGSHGDMDWMINTDGNDWMDSTPESIDPKSWEETSARPDSCGCLLSSISFLERLTSRSGSRESRIDRLLADVRNSTDTLAMLLACELCTARVAQNMLLAMAVRQLSILCKKMVGSYKALRQSGFGDMNSLWQKPEFDASASLINISISTYRVSQREGLHVLESLVSLQILELQQYINTIKSRFCNEPHQGQAEAVIEAENNTKLAQAAIGGQS